MDRPKWTPGHFWRDKWTALSGPLSQGATEAEAMAAAETANARQFIEALPDGVRTYVGNSSQLA